MQPIPGAIYFFTAGSTAVPTFSSRTSARSVKRCARRASFRRGVTGGLYPVDWLGGGAEPAETGERP